MTEPEADLRVESAPNKYDFRTVVRRHAEILQVAWRAFAERIEALHRSIVRSPSPPRSLRLPPPNPTPASPEKRGRGRPPRADIEAAMRLLPIDELVAMTSPQAMAKRFGGDPKTCKTIREKILGEPGINS